MAGTPTDKDLPTNGTVLKLTSAKNGQAVVNYMTNTDKVFTVIEAKQGETTGTYLYQVKAPAKAAYTSDPIEMKVGYDYYVFVSGSKIAVGYVEFTPYIETTEAFAGDTIKVLPSANDGYSVDEVSYTPENGNKNIVAQSAEGYTFSMPEANVEINVAFKEGAEPSATPAPTATAAPATETPAPSATVEPTEAPATESPAPTDAPVSTIAPIPAKGMTLPSGVKTTDKSSKVYNWNDKATDEMKAVFGDPLTGVNTEALVPMSAADRTISAKINVSAEQAGSYKLMVLGIEYSNRYYNVKVDSGNAIAPENTNPGKVALIEPTEGNADLTITTYDLGELTEGEHTISVISAANNSRDFFAMGFVKYTPAPATETPAPTEEPATATPEPSATAEPTESPATETPTPSATAMPIDDYIKANIDDVNNQLVDGDVQYAQLVPNYDNSTVDVEVLDGTIKNMSVVKSIEAAIGLVNKYDPVAKYAVHYDGSDYATVSAANEAATNFDTVDNRPDGYKSYNPVTVFGKDDSPSAIAIGKAVSASLGLNTEQFNSISTTDLATFLGYLEANSKYSVNVTAYDVDGNSIFTYKFTFADKQPVPSATAEPSATPAFAPQTYSYMPKNSGVAMTAGQALIDNSDVQFTITSAVTTTATIDGAFEKDTYPYGVPFRGAGVISSHMDDLNSNNNTAGTNVVIKPVTSGTVTAYVAINNGKTMRIWDNTANKEISKVTPDTKKVNTISGRLIKGHEYLLYASGTSASLVKVEYKTTDEPDPTPDPTAVPTAEPTEVPTEAPATAEPTEVPSATPGPVLSASDWTAITTVDGCEVSVEDPDGGNTAYKFAFAQNVRNEGWYFDLAAACDNFPANYSDADQMITVSYDVFAPTDAKPNDNWFIDISSNNDKVNTWHGGTAGTFGRFGGYGNNNNYKFIASTENTMSALGCKEVEGMAYGEWKTVTEKIDLGTKKVFVGQYGDNAPITVVGYPSSVTDGSLYLKVRPGESSGNVNGAAVYIKNINITYGESDTYTLTKGTVTGGDISFSNDTPKAGETVTVTALPTNAGDILTALTANGAFDVQITGSTTATFVMPAADITVDAEISSKKDIILPTYGEYTDVMGVVSCDKTQASEGETVQISAIPYEGYRVAGYTVTDEGGQSVAVFANGEFTMPAQNVNINATFEKKVDAEILKFKDMTYGSDTQQSFRIAKDNNVTLMNYTKSAALIKFDNVDFTNLQSVKVVTTGKSDTTMLSLYAADQITDDVIVGTTPVTSDSQSRTGGKRYETQYLKLNDGATAYASAAAIGTQTQATDKSNYYIHTIDMSSAVSAPTGTAPLYINISDDSSSGFIGNYWYLVLEYANVN